jgi:gliding motility-associated-like protein
MGFLFPRILLSIFISMKYYFVFSLLFVSSALFSQEAPGNFKAMSAPLALEFYENKGQWPSEVLFKAEKEGGKWWIMKDRMWYHLQDLSAMNHAHNQMNHAKEPSIKQHIVQVKFLKSQEFQGVDVKGKTNHYQNYLIGKDSTRWASDVHGYTQVIRKGLYPDIDLTLLNEGLKHEYGFIVHPGGNPENIQLQYKGQSSISLNRRGWLVLKTPLGTVSEEQLMAYQEKNGERISVDCSYKIEGDNVSLKLGNYDKSVPLIIDPTLVFATYNGAFSDNFGMTATYGQNGEAYSGGMVYGNAFPIPNPSAYDPAGNFSAIGGNYGITDVFITKYNPTGTALLWSTFLGGGDMVQGTETANSMICDSLNNILIFGATSSIDFPTTAGAVQSNHAGGVANANFLFNGVYFLTQGTDLFVSKISSNGQNLLASTYLGGTGNDGVNYKINSLPYNSVAAYDSLTTNYGDQFRGEISLDQSGNVLVASCTRSLNFPTQNAFQPNLAGGQDGVIFRMNPGLTSLQFSSYLGGTQNDACYSVKVDTLNNILTCGGTSSSNFPGTVGGLWANYQGGKTDGFVIRLNPSGTSITAGSYLGRTQYDQTFFVEVDRDNNVFVLGQSEGGIFPTWNAPYTNSNSSQFVIKMSNNLATNMASATIGNGSSQINISPAAFLVDVCGNIYISGWGANILQNVPLSGMPVSVNAYQPNTTGFDFYLMVLEHDFLSLLYATYMGGNFSTEHVDGGTSRFDKNGVVYQSVCGGCGGQSDFPTTPGAYSNVNNSANCNNLLFKFDFDLIPSAQFIANQTIGCEDLQVTFNNFSTLNDDYLWDFGNNNTSSSIFNPTIIYQNPGVYQVYLYVTDSVCALTDTAMTTITVLDSINFTLLDTASLCSNNPYLLTINTNGAPSQYLWSTNASFTPPINSGPNDPDYLVASNAPGWYYASASNGYCSKTDSIYVEFGVPVVAAYQLSPQSGCSPITINFNNSSTATTNFYWDFGNGTVDSVNFEPQVTYVQPGQYTTQLIVLDTICNASDTSSVVITVFPNVSFNLPNNLYLCTDTSLVLLPTNILGGANNFIWSSSNLFSDTLNASVVDSSLEILVPENGMFYLSADNGNCFYSDSIEIQVFSESISISGPDSVCLNSPTLYNAVNSSQETFTYQWSPANIVQGPSNQASVTITPAANQYLYLQATSTNGCVVEDSIYIFVSYINPSLVQASVNPPIVNPGSTVTLTGSPSGYPFYQWVPSTGVLNPNSQTTEATVDVTTVFTLLVSDGICSVNDTVEVKVYEIICDLPYVFVPNAFSPNNDGNNDVLYVRGLFVEKMLFRVFDRWGEMVFESTDVNFGWNGIYQDRKLDPDVYDYYLQVTCYGGLEKITKGNVTLMK